MGAQLRLDRRVLPPTFAIASPGKVRARRWRRREGRQEFMVEKSWIPDTLSCRRKLLAHIEQMN